MAISWTPQFKVRDATLLEEKEVFSGYSKIKQFQFAFSLFQGGKSQPVSRELMIRSPAVAVLLYDPVEDKVVMIEQFRAAAMLESEGPWLLEIAAGLVEPEESVEEAAHREVKEETGCNILSLIPICCYFTTPGISNEKIYIYCAQIHAPSLGGIYGITEEGEDIKVHVFSAEEAFTLLSQGRVVSSPAIIALQWLKINQSSLHFPQ